jgi:dolichyl-phosphate beta-glucosyltransferase
MSWTARLSVWNKPAGGYNTRGDVFSEELNGMQSKTLSVVIPAYNEETRLLPSLQRITEYFSAVNLDYELIVVDDGSRDDTAGLARRFAAAHPGVRVLRNAKNRGKGGAVRRGMAAARGEWILFSDADLSTPIEEYEKLAAVLQRSPQIDVVVASRDIQGAQVARHQPFYRELMGKTFNLFVQGIVFRGIHDTQCGFKLFRRETARKIFLDMTIPGFGFDVEVLYLARKFKHNIVEVPVIWKNVGGSKVSPVRDSIRMFSDLIRIKMRHG